MSLLCAINVFQNSVRSKIRFEHSSTIKKPYVSDEIISSRFSFDIFVWIWKIKIHKNMEKNDEHRPKNHTWEIKIQALGKLMNIDASFGIYQTS